MGYLDSEGLGHLIAKIKAAISDATKKYLPLTGGTITGNLTIKGSGNYGTQINLGDGDYVHIAEPTDDCLEIKAKKINFLVSDTTDAKFTLNGEKIGGGGSGGVASFNSRTGAVTPANADYTVEQVTGAAPKESPVFTGAMSLGRKANTTSGKGSFACGYDAEASGAYSCAMGVRTKATHARAFAFGSDTIAQAEGQFVVGLFNKPSTITSNVFIAGYGTSSAQANCFRASNVGVYATGSYNATGADYAELFEWADGNPDHQDRAGLFVTLDGTKIRIAGPGDDYIVGIISGNPSVVGDVHDDQWQGMYLYDIFGRPVWEDVEVSAEVGQDGEIIVPAHTERRQKLNPDFDNSKAYLPRSQRPEWDAVGMLGKLVAVDDGTCQVNGWCAPSEGGIATHSDVRTQFRVMERLDQTHVRVLIL